MGINQALISEHVERSWYENGPLNANDDLHPSVGVTDPVAPPKTSKANAYSWIKAPRYNKDAMEVGPLARMWVNGSYSPAVAQPQGAIHAPFSAPGYLNAALPGPPPGTLPGLGVSAAVISGNATYTPGISVMDRHRARCLEALKIIQRIRLGWLPAATALAANPANAIVGSKSLPAQGATGYGLNEAPRGALGHWLKMGSAGRVERYQCVVPTTWNGSPRAAHTGVGARGPIEEALCNPALNLTGANSNGEYTPVEGLRVVHSFDPCIACAVHVIDANGKKLTKIR
jgi:[NiFe] hydrogenase large subunit